MKNSSKTPSHYQKATGHSDKYVINKSSGPVKVGNQPKSNGTKTLHPYHGKKGC